MRSSLNTQIQSISREKAERIGKLITERGLCQWEITLRMHPDGIEEVSLRLIPPTTMRSPWLVNLLTLVAGEGCDLAILNVSPRWSPGHGGEMAVFVWDKTYEEPVIYYA